MPSCSPCLQVPLARNRDRSDPSPPQCGEEGGIRLGEKYSAYHFHPPNDDRGMDGSIGWDPAPSAKHLMVVGGHPPFLIPKHIHRRRHFSELYLFPNLGRQSVPVFHGELVPGREIQLVAPTVYVMGNDPGKRRNFPVPGPNRLVGMAIETRPPE